MTALTIDELIFKGTHNSYSCGRGRALGMNHSPDKQIDDFGVWSLELDFGLELHGGAPVPVVGHDRPGHRACWGYFLRDYLKLVLGTRALQFRPVFIHFDIKAWKRPWLQPWRTPSDRAFSFQDKWSTGLDVLRSTCSESLVVLEDWVLEHGRWPLPMELAGKVVLYEPNKRTGDGRLVGLRGTHAAHCVSPSLVEDAIESGRPMERNGFPCAGGARAIRLDQYQAAWTFDYGVPPNPLVVAPAAPVVHDAEAKRRRCEGESSHGQEVGQHGTYRFPYRTMEQAVERARGITSATGGLPDARRAGYGWTILAKGNAIAASGYEFDFPMSVRPMEG